MPAGRNGSARRSDRTDVLIREVLIKTHWPICGSVTRPLSRKPMPREGTATQAEISTLSFGGRRLPDHNDGEIQGLGGTGRSLAMRLGLEDNVSLVILKHAG